VIAIGSCRDRSPAAWAKATAAANAVAAATARKIELIRPMPVLLRRFC
jgi:hypothetical protein